MPNPSSTNLKQDRPWLIKKLRASEEVGASELADVLDTCTDARPCGSAACLDCGKAFQRNVPGLFGHFIREPARIFRDRMSALTIIPASGCLAPDDLTVGACQRAGNEIITALANLGSPPTLMMMDVSFNEDETGEVEDYCCVHWHGARVDWLSLTQKKALRAAFPQSRLAKRPVCVQKIDDPDRWFEYISEPERDRRVTYLNDSDPTRAPYRATRHRDLRTWQAVSLALVDHRLGFHGRVLTHGIDDEAVRRHLEGLGWPRDGP